MNQLQLFGTVNLRHYDYIVISSSGGKDSQAMLAHVHAQAVLQGVEDRVWETIRATKMPVHPAYALGMGRLSCVFRILAPKAQLQLATKHNIELFERYVAPEKALEHTFKHKMALGDINL